MLRSMAHTRRARHYEEQVQQHAASYHATCACHQAQEAWRGSLTYGLGLPFLDYDSASQDPRLPSHVTLVWLHRFNSSSPSITKQSMIALLVLPSGILVPQFFCACGATMMGTRGMRKGSSLSIVLLVRRRLLMNMGSRTADAGPGNTGQLHAWELTP